MSKPKKIETTHKVTYLPPVYDSKRLWEGINEIINCVEARRKEKAMKDIPKSELAPEAKEGDVIFLVNGKYQVEQDETQRRKVEIAKLSENMWE